MMDEGIRISKSLTLGIPKDFSYKFSAAILLGIRLKNLFSQKGSLMTSIKLGWILIILRSPLSLLEVDPLF